MVSFHKLRPPQASGEGSEELGECDTTYSSVGVLSSEEDTQHSQGRSIRIASVARYAILALVVVAALLAVSLEGVSFLITHTPLDRADTDGIVGLMAPVSWQRSTPYRQVAACPDTGEVCICSDDYVQVSADGNGQRRFKAQSKGVACNTFRFQVGDVIFFEKPKGIGPAFFKANVVAHFTASPIVHAGIVSYVPPDQGQMQTPDDIIVTEGLKGNYKRVTQQSLRHVIQRWNFGAFHVRRVAPKFVHFKEHSQAITDFLNKVHGQPFDPDMLVPVKRRFATNGRFIKPDYGVTCEERQRAKAMYDAGGPGKWTCSQLVAWTLGFAGGLNTDYMSKFDNCPDPQPGFVIEDMQEWPGRLMEENIWDPTITWSMPCNDVTCWVGAPKSWPGGHPPGSAAASLVGTQAAAPAAAAVPSTVPAPATAAPVPVPTPAAVPVPTPAPVPLPVTAPVPVPATAPVPAPEPVPASVPVPAPESTEAPVQGTAASQPQDAANAMQAALSAGHSTTPAAVATTPDPSPQTTKDLDLPAGWGSQMDEVSHRRYYYKLPSGSATWTRPTEPATK